MDKAKKPTIYILTIEVNGSNEEIKQFKDYVGSRIRPFEFSKIIPIIDFYKKIRTSEEKLELENLNSELKLRGLSDPCEIFWGIKQYNYHPSEWKENTIEITCARTLPTKLLETLVEKFPNVKYSHVIKK